MTHKEAQQLKIGQWVYHTQRGKIIGRFQKLGGYGLVWCYWETKEGSGVLKKYATTIHHSDVFHMRHRNIEEDPELQGVFV